MALIVNESVFCVDVFFERGKGSAVEEKREILYLLSNHGAACVELFCFVACVSAYKQHVLICLFVCLFFVSFAYLSSPIELCCVKTCDNLY